MAYTPPTSSPRSASNSISVVQCLGENVQYVFDFLPLITASDPNDTLTGTPTINIVGSGLTASAATIFQTTTGTIYRQVYAKLTLAGTVTPGTILYATCVVTTVDGQTLSRTFAITAINDTAGASVYPSAVDQIYSGDIFMVVFDFTNQLTATTDYIRDGNSETPGPAISVPANLTKGTPVVHGNKVWVLVTANSTGTAVVTGFTYQVTCQITSHNSQYLTQTRGLYIRDPRS